MLVKIFNLLLEDNVLVDYLGATIHFRLAVSYFVKNIINKIFRNVI